MAEEAYRLLIPTTFLIILSFYFDLFVLGILSFLFGLFLLYFFRDPERNSDLDKNFLLSPADGKVLSVNLKQEDQFNLGRCHVISIFMSPFDVHVNRSPVDGEVLGLRYERGEFGAAFKEGVEKKNERNFILIGREGRKFLVVQIAGFFARRIFCYVKEGEKVKRGQRIGMIAFGSRVDTFIPEEFEILVKEGQKLKAGITPIAKRGGL